MKALFDRCNGLIHCMALEGKYAAVVETSGGGDDQEVVGVVATHLGPPLLLLDVSDVIERVVEPATRGQGLMPHSEDASALRLDQQGVEPLVAAPIAVTNRHPARFPILRGKVEERRVEDTDHRLHVVPSDVFVLAAARIAPGVAV